MKRKELQDVLVFKIASTIGDIVLLNILFLICSLPIFTIGASYTSMYTAASKIGGKDLLVVKTFFESFKENFKKSTLVWLILLIPIFILIIEFNLLNQVIIEVPTVLYVCILIPTLFLMVYFVWLFIQPTYFEVTIKQQFKNAFLLMLRLIPQSVMILIFAIFPILAFIFDIKSFLYAWPVWLLLYFSSTACLIAISLKKPMSYLGEQINKK